MARVGKPMTIEHARAGNARVRRPQNPVTLAENVTQAVQQIITEGRRFHLRGTDRSRRPT